MALVGSASGMRVKDAVVWDEEVKRVARERALEAVLFADPRSESLKRLGENLELLLRVAFIDGANWERGRAARADVARKRSQTSKR